MGERHPTRARRRGRTGEALNDSSWSPPAASAPMAAAISSRQRVGHRGVRRRGLPVHPGDRRPGQDVVELVQQHGFPEPVELLVRVRHAQPRPTAVVHHSSASRSRCSAAPVALLGRRLRGVGAPVQLQVELADPDRRVLAVLLLRPRRRTRPAARSRPAASPPGRPPAGRGRASPGSARHRRRRARTAAATGSRAPLSRKFRTRVRQLGAGQVAVVGVGRREVGEHPGAVDALPPEGVVREPVGLVPRDLLGQEPARPAQRDDLRQRGGVAERVGQPRLLGLDAELLEEDTASRARTGAPSPPPPGMLVSDSTHIPPTGTNRPDRHVLGDPGEHLRPVLLQPGELLGRGHRVHQVRMGVQQVGDVGGGTRDLAHGLAQRPQPRGVDVRVPDGGDPVRAGVRGPGEHVGQRVAGARRRCPTGRPGRARPSRGTAPAGSRARAARRPAARPAARRAPRGRAPARPAARRGP